MSKAGRLALIALAVVVAGVAFAVARPSDDDDGSSATPTADSTERTPTATTRSALPPPPAEPRPEVTRIELRDHVAVGGAKSIEVEKGDLVRIVVTSDQPDDIHLHGYDIERSVAAGGSVTFRFRASIEGVFELESHEAEHAGEEPLVARLIVEPS